MSRHSRSQVLDSVRLQFSFLNQDARPMRRTWQDQGRSHERNKIVASRGFCHVAFPESAESFRPEPWY